MGTSIIVLTLVFIHHKVTIDEGLYDTYPHMSGDVLLQDACGARAFPQMGRDTIHYTIYKGIIRGDIKILFL